MAELGKVQELEIAEIIDIGAVLGTERILLPKKDVPEGAAAGDTVKVMVYKDSEDRIIATTKEPRIQLGETAVLKVADVTGIGAFLDWGLEKDLLLPFREQTRKVASGEEVLAALYVDKSGRLAATMNVYDYLSTDHDYKRGDRVTGRIYETSDNFGVFVAVDDKYSGLIPQKEVTRKYRIGDIVECRVTLVKRDGKLDLSPNEKAYKKMKSDSSDVLEIIKENYGGKLPFDDKADPELIKKEFGISKAAFKRAVGKLYKERLIRIEDGRIYTI